MQIYLARNNEQAGPYTLEQLNQMLANGQVVLEDLAWHEGMPEWKKLGELTQGQLFYKPILVTAPAVATVVDLNKSWTNPNSNNTTSTLPIDNNLATVNKRILAKVIDVLLIWLPLSFILLSTMTGAQLAQLEKIQSGSAIPSLEQQQQIATLFMSLPQQAFWALGIYVVGYYFIQAMLLLKTGQTIGKKAVGIRIVDDQTGKKTGLLRSLVLRSLVFVVLTNLLGIGFILYIIDFAFIFTKRNRTLHDRLAKTVVVNAAPDQLT